MARIKVSIGVTKSQNYNSHRYDITSEFETNSSVSSAISKSFAKLRAELKRQMEIDKVAD